MRIIFLQRAKYASNDMAGKIICLKNSFIFMVKIKPFTFFLFDSLNFYATFAIGNN
jgi:hypothetical protein